MSELKKNKKVKKEKKNFPKRVHLSLDQIDHKITAIEDKLKTLEGVANKNKRLRYYREVALLKKAKDAPETMVVDPIIKNEKRQKDKMRRIAKKILKKKEVVAQKKAEHNKLRRINCLYCQKCELKRWTYHARLQVQN